MRRIVVTLLALCIGAIPASAGISDRPDVLDVNSTFSSESPDDASFNTAYIRHMGNQNNAGGSIGNYTSTYSSEAELYWVLYAPDTVKRKDNRARQSQRTYVALGFYTWNTWSGGSWDSTAVEDCRAATRTYGVDGDPTTASWQVRCRGALEAMGLSPDQAERLENLLDRHVNESADRIKIDGKGPVGGDI